MPEVGVVLIAATALFSCKTTEENYRAAYEKTMAARQESTALDSTIYGAARRQMRHAELRTADGRSVEVRRLTLRLTDGQHPANMEFQPFNIVAGQFKQLFNASSLRDRLIAAGYSDAFVAETAEPYYYVVAKSTPDITAAADALEALKVKAPVKMKEPCPFILEATGRKKPLH